MILSPVAKNATMEITTVEKRKRKLTLNQKY